MKQAPKPDIKQALQLGLESTHELLGLLEATVGRDHVHTQRAAELYEQQINTIKAALDYMNRQHVIGQKSYEYSCGDGCCYEQGYDVSLNGEHITSVPEVEHALEELFDEFGIDVTIEREY